MNLTGASNCTAADFDTTVQLMNGPGDSYSMLINRRNLANHPCTFVTSVSGMASASGSALAWSASR